MATKKTTKKSGKKGIESSPTIDNSTPEENSLKVESIVEETTDKEEDNKETPEEAKAVELEEEYEIPVLAQIIVENYEGDIEKGFFHGNGEASFEGGCHYKGQFVKGEMHGEGIYTWPDGLVYEGNFERNRINGKGKYYWLDGTVYEGEVENGVRQGYGTQVIKGGKKYEGEWKLGKRCGRGKMDYDEEGTSYYSGDWVDNIRQGWGMRRYPSGSIYVGCWWRNRRHGHGKMRWKNEYYVGEFKDGIQHGRGQHVWLSKGKSDSSQYPLRNIYDGEWKMGEREGYGVFFYANGARYEGQWKRNAKEGKGKFIFKNGRVYEGEFHKDHIVDYPDFTMDHATTPDLTNIRTRTPLPSEAAMSVQSNESRNTLGPSFQLDIPIEAQDDADQVKNIVIRYITELRKIYSFYSCLGIDHEKDPEEVYVMDKLQFWRFLKDIKLHLRQSLFDLDLILGTRHDPDQPVLFRDFLQYIVNLSAHIYGSNNLAASVKRLIGENILKYACTVGGLIFSDPRRTPHITSYRRDAYAIFLALGGESLTARQFLILLKTLNLLSKELTAKNVIDVLASDDDLIRPEENALNLERKIVFLEFLEALVGCAQVFVTPDLAQSAVRASLTPSPPPSMTLQEPQDAEIIEVKSAVSLTERKSSSKAFIKEDSKASINVAKTPG
ncbi:DgyrCDS11895 [Dimorphilus gyrociliatus]|uniref:DgyrCDS11895 n=1 Tax=Dimorphilus gyrociliatus TaxID=2664684 RepID=A0A7I8W4T8_9ANNE|nr:DgyrCDS11895 [Dimorphilus gyrociliatus]